MNLFHRNPNSYQLAQHFFHPPYKITIKTYTIPWNSSETTIFVVKFHEISVKHFF